MHADDKQSDQHDWGFSKLTESQRDKVRDFFESKYYARTNPELLLDDEELLFHYLREGWRQGRNPGSGFSTLKHLLRYPKLAGSGVHPLFHHLFGDSVLPGASASPDLVNAMSALPPLADLSGLVPTPGHTIEPRAAIAPLSEEEALRGLSTTEIAILRREFDVDYYLAENPAVRISGTDPFLHYMMLGWLERRDPTPDFSTHFYLDLHADITASGRNPFIHWVLHGKAERRMATSFRQKLARKAYAPKVSAIVPNYNHARFLPQRLDSILAQTYPNIEITVLDDCSTDDSRVVIDDYVARYPDRISKVFNDTNSGGVFKQWRKGVEGVDGEIVWLCESDDFCEPDFVEKLVPCFADDSVQMAFGRILETDVEGTPNLWLDTYRERTEPGIWNSTLVRPAAEWFAHSFGISNMIANVGGCLFRRAPLPASVWQQAATYRVVGDWYLYSQIAAGGQIAWEPEAISYFRRHGSNTSSTSFSGTGFYLELERLMLELRRTWHVPDQTVLKFYGFIREQYDHFGLEEKLGPLEAHCNLSKMLGVTRERAHILLTMLGFVPGGGENFPIQLANSLIEQGWIVSMLVFESDEVNAHMRAALNPAVSVYDAAWVTEYGCDRFVREAGVSLIHSHTVGSEFRFYQLWNLDPELPYVVTLHGSYEASDLPPDVLTRITRSIDHFVYTADKNLLPFKDEGINPALFTKMANAMPIDPLPFPETRAEMGIAEDAIVFTLVARGIKRKGWRTAIEAFHRVRKRHPDRPMHLCLVGEGEEPDRHRKIHGDDPDISFLGYQARIHGLYRISDIAIVPTRFSGESYPLCIIQSLQVGTPVVASDAGEIDAMLHNAAGVRGGIVMHAVRDTDAFITAFADAMEKMLDDRRRCELAEGALTLGSAYDMTPLVGVYGDIYTRVLADAGSPVVLAT